MLSLAQRNGANGRTVGPQRVALYVRVSTEEQLEGYSLDAQRRAAAAYCEGHGWEIVRTYADEGKSARTDDLAKRPEFRAMLADAEAGLVDVVLVHKLDRFARNLRVTLETLDRLDRARVGFVSIAEQMDFTSPIGKVILATLGAFAQFYSDNLSQETRKGKQERKAQGLYNGLLPFGVKKSREGLPVPDPDTYPGLLLAFRSAAAGKPDRAIADELNAAGYRTTGNRGRNPFTKDSVRPMLRNRFYLGELPDGRGGWVEGAHDAVLDADLYDAAQRTRAANRLNSAKVRSTTRRYSLSGLARCGHCGGALHFHLRKGQPAVYCYQRRQSGAAPCRQREQLLAPIEEQIGAYLSTFRLSEDEVERIIRLHADATEQHDDAERERRELEARRERIAELFKWGDMTREAYQAEREQIARKLAGLSGTSSKAAVLAQTAAFLRDLPGAWEDASPEDRNALARVVFQSIEITDDRATAIVPTPDFAPFFVAAAENDETPDTEVSGVRSNKRKRRVSRALVRRIADHVRIELPDLRPACRQRVKPGRYAEPRTAIPADRWLEVTERARRDGLRATAAALGVSHEAVRGVVRRVEESDHLGRAVDPVVSGAL